MILFYILIFIIGLCVGSFFNVILFRLDRKKGIMTGRSECQNCHQQLRWHDLIPLISYLYLRGNCRYCRSEISMVYPLIELATGLIFVVFFIVAGPMIGLKEVISLSIILLFFLLIFFDALYLILPDKIVFTAIGASFFFGAFFDRLNLGNLTLTGFLFGLFFGIIYLVSRGQWMGFGDVKLVVAIGLVLGYPLGLFAIVLAVWVAALWGIFLMLFKKADLKTALPFGSFLSASTIIFIFLKGFIEESVKIYYEYFL